MNIIKKLPLLLTLLRGLLAPVILLLAIFYPSAICFSICLVTAFLSDIFDGFIARRLGVATDGIRRLDSIADTLFYICATVAIYWLYPAAIDERLLPLGILVTLELLRYGFDYSKYGREASYHMWSSKLWGILLFVGFIDILGFGQDGILLSMAIVMGIIADIEGLLISLLMPKWRCDIPTLFHAIKIRNSELNDPVRN
ncbi:CDP-alcohol phosphatidyltransferase family protein [Gallaecimonas mangrovi]|uniref:CDP-alcohol phosphatidyltransferase family protein n=1 Tax=Gallaecimonas mangrovi TaxID=2291597 RepID=UPI000E208F26|nr:CDP-alcohol phosphatidyltransferase family protein [Gallaecimonas mangrovi]